MNLDEDQSLNAGTARQTALKAREDQSGTTKGKFHNCRRRGHYIKDCWEKGGGKEG